jgi:hypothetical protein
MLVNRKTKPAASEVSADPVEAKIEATVEDVLALIRETVRTKLTSGMATHELQDAQTNICAMLDELELMVVPRKKD